MPMLKQLLALEQDVQDAYVKLHELVKNARLDYTAEEEYAGVEAMTYSHMLIHTVLKSIQKQIDAIIALEKENND